MDLLLRRPWPALLFVLCVGLAGPARADLFSPGPLSKAHQQFEGLRNCTRCHEGGQGLSQAKCLSCHTELKPEIAKHQGFHGRIPDAQRECQSCHHEHQGREFAMLDWGRGGKQRFDHAKTGWLLQGKHAQVRCEACHQKRLVVDKGLLAMLAKQPTRHSFLGLSTRCAACHFDEHRGQLGDDCARCHGTTDWKKAAGFDHAKTDYPLTGKHRQVACQKCHAPKSDTQTPKDAFPAPRSQTFLTLSGIPHDGCVTCHADPHGGKFAQRCESCHVTDGWLKVKSGSLNRSFHDKTRFPLRGLHADVACKSCHGPFPGQRAKFKGLAFGACTDCHADAHEGQLATLAGRQRAPDCDACHSENGFSPTRYTLADHAKSPFPLEGAHQAVPCESCHPSRPKLLDRVPRGIRAALARKRRKPLFSDVLFLIPGKLDRCETCHADPHAGQFAARIAKEGCQGCHQVSSFHALRFDHARDTRYPLEGPHAKAPCAGCHRPDAKGVVAYRGTPTECARCHADPHAGQFAKGGDTDCARCHTVSDFTEAPGFRHAPPFTRFLLDGAHAKAACTACHAQVAIQGKAVQRFVGLPTSCAGCHQDFHQGAFQGFSP
jgi:hypothetical protein